MHIDGIVLHTDGSGRGGRAGWGLMGYTYSNAPLTERPKKIKVDAVKANVPTADGFAPAKSFKGETVTPINMIEGWGSLLRDRTNNHGEMMGMYNALKYIDTLDPLPSKVLILADSTYVIKSLTDYITKWRKNGWRTSTGPVKHREKWDVIDTLYRKLKEAIPSFEIRHIKAHAGHFGNEMADQLASMASGGDREEEHLVETPYEKWIDTAKEGYQLNPLLLKGGLFFEITDGERNPRYYFYHLRSRSDGNKRQNDTFEEKVVKRDAYLGTPVSDQIYGVVHLKERDELIDDLIDLHKECHGEGFTEFATMRLDLASRISFYGMFRRLGVGSVYKLDHSHVCVGTGDNVISRTLRPPLRAYDAAKTYEEMDHRLTQYMDGKVDPGAQLIEITDRLIEPVQKTPKSKVDWKMRQDIPLKDKYILFEDTVHDSHFKVKLIFGTDLPDRQAIGRIASEDTKIFLSIYRSGIVYTYDVIVETVDGYGIYSSPNKMVFAKG